jgi:uncharacterized protein (TIGR00645 family)
MENTENKEVKKEIEERDETILERILLSSKYLLIPFFFGLMVSLAIYTYLDIKEIYHLFHQVKELDPDTGMLMLLEIIDLAMVAFLVKLIIVGSYTSFYKKHENSSKKDPNLNTSSGVLKVKIATALIGVTSINLLAAFIKPGVTSEDLEKKLLIHGMLLIGALVLAAIDWMHVKAEALHHQDCICCKEKGLTH